MIKIISNGFQYMRVISDEMVSEIEVNGRAMVLPEPRPFDEVCRILFRGMRAVLQDRKTDHGMKTYYGSVVVTRTFSILGD